MCSRARLRFAPQSGVGGGAPRPRKERAARMSITKPSEIVAWIIAGDRQLGRICRNAMARCPSPTTRAASTYSRSRSARTAPRTRRAILGIWAIPSATMSPAVFQKERQLIGLDDGGSNEVEQDAWERQPGIDDAHQYRV